MVRSCLLIAVSVASLALASRADAIVLYDGTLNTLPGGIGGQGWLFGSTGSPTQSASGGVTTLTSAVSDYAGYAAHAIFTVTSGPFAGSYDQGVPGLPTPFNRATGYTVRFNVKVNSESHSSTDRAGFSIIALSSDKVGVELGFWTNEIFAQTDNTGPGYFIHGEGSSFSTAAIHQYDLAILGSQYKLYADNNLILTGALRDYSGSGTTVNFTSPLGPTTMQPYNTPNFLFLGDDTTSAGAGIDLARVEMFATALPEPATGTLMATAGMCLGGLAAYRRRRRVSRIRVSSQV